MLTDPPVFNKHQRDGEVAERLNAPVLKTGMGASPSWVRIPPSPPSTVHIAHHIVPLTQAGLEFY